MENKDLKRTCYENWLMSVVAARRSVAESRDEIAKLAKTHEFARWRVAEKCGWSNSLNGQCQDGEPKSNYPDDLETADAEVMEAIRKFIDIHRRMKTAKARLKKHHKQLTRLLKKPVAFPGFAIGVPPLVLTFSKSGELMEVGPAGHETPAPKTIHVKQWQEVDFLHNAQHAEYKVDRAAANDLFLQYQGTEKRGEDTIEKYEAFNYGTTFYLHVDVETDKGTSHKAIPFEVEPDTP